MGQRIDQRLDSGPSLNRDQAPGGRSPAADGPGARASRPRTSPTVTGTLAGPRACGRCGGLMVVIGMNDLTLEHDYPAGITGWRCLLCGDILDPRILAYRKYQRQHGGTRRPAVRADR